MKIPHKILHLFTIFCVIWFQQYTANAQTPGGTSLEVELWLQANKVQSAVPADGSNISLWQDQSSKGINFVQNGTNLVPRIKYGGMNYQPSVEFYTDVESGNASSAERARKLVGASTMAISTSKSYYSFFVSSMDETQSSAYATVFNYGGDTDNNDGWRNSTDNKAIWMESVSGGSNIHSTGVQKTYGIGAVVRPNTTGSTNLVRLYHNGKINTNTMSRGVLTNGSNTPYIGKSNSSTENYFFGEIHEIIVLSAPTNGTYISDVDLNRIHSYLAIKYGIYLEGQDYYKSDGTTKVWDLSENPTYNKDIFGIARDDNSGLYQKQSKSENFAKFTVFVGDNIADINDNNTTGTLSDQDYLMLGSNGLTEFSDYRYEAGFDGFQNDVIAEEVNVLFKRVFRVQASKMFTVNMSAPGKYVLVSSSDPTFAPENTRIYPVGEDGIARNVEVSDGDYVGFAAFEQGPGGIVNGLRVWLRADDLNSLSLVNGNKVDVWRDQTSNGNHYSFADVTYSGKTRPTYTTCASEQNFNPTILFGLTDYLAIRNGPMYEDAPNDFTSFVLYYATAYADNRRLYTHGFGSTNPRDEDNRRPAMGFAPLEGVGRVRNSGGSPGQTDVDGSVPGFVQRSAALQMINTRKQAYGGQGYAIHDFGGWQEKVTATGEFGNGFKMASGATLGGASLADASFQGYISEVFFYEQALTPEEQDKVRTYLGMKYALTLDTDGNNFLVGYNYLLSDGTSIWNGNEAPNNAYHRNVAGLVYDKSSDLFINKAKSSAVNATITMMVKGHTECGQGDAPALGDLTALYWGHDGANNTIVFDPDDPSYEDICGEIDYRLGRVWLVQKTNMEKITVSIRASSSDVFNYNSPSYKMYLLVADSKEKLATNQWDMIVPGEYIDGEQQVDFTFLEKYTYFSLGVKAVPGACQGCDFDGVKKLDFNTWARGGKTQSFDLGNNFQATVEATIESPGVFRSRYPRASSQRSLREYRYRDARAVMKTVVSFKDKSTNEILSATGKFDIFEIDYRGGKYDNVKVYGLCDGATVAARLSYHLPESRSSYEIIGNTAFAKRRPTSSYTAARGKMNVAFNYPVQQIVVEHTTTGRATGSKRIGIGPMEFKCPVPLPPVNEDGLAFDKQAPLTAEDCENVTYTFRIQNTNCAPKTVDFFDELEDGMIWTVDGLQLPDAIRDNAMINAYEGIRTLDIKNLIVPGSTTLEFDVIAKFEDNLGTKFGLNHGDIKTFKNNAVINYKKLVNSVEEDADPLSANEVQTTVTINDNRPKRVVVKSFMVNNACYKENKTYTVTITIDNPNDYSIDNSILDLGFNEEFKYVTGTLTGTNNILSGTTTDSSEDGFVTLEDVSIKTGESTITFKVKAPAAADLIQDIDENGNLIFDKNSNPVWMALGIDFDFYKETSSSICDDTILTEANGYTELPYCLSKDCVISNVNVTPTIIK